MTLPATIICMKWGTRYGPEYVNRLYGMVARHLSVPFQLVCFTDDAGGIDERVSIRDLPALDLPAEAPERGWNKLTTLQAGLGGLQGEALFLDLDVVIVDRIDDFFTYPAEFAIIPDARLRRRMIGNSSVYRFKIGKYDDILQRFRRDFAQIRRQFRNEQAYLSAEIRKRGELSFWPDAWCPSFKHDCMPSWPLTYFRDAPIPTGAKIIVFHGHPKPPDAIAGVSRKWYRPVRPTAWVANHWRD